MDCKDCNAHLAVIGKQKTLCHDVEKLETETKSDVNLIFEAIENKTKDKVSMTALKVIIGIVLVPLTAMSSIIGTQYVEGKETNSLAHSLITEIKIAQVQLQNTNKIMEQHLKDSTNVFKEIRENMQRLENKIDGTYKLKQMED
jgi:phage shock protein A|tara:strand:- start:2389 stop:2820 length:432 start_codon:yes stop_codon:yes gene_type:complete